MKNDSYIAIIQRVADGEIRRCLQTCSWADEVGYTAWGWWSDGNMSCDCNRFLEFERAGGIVLIYGDERCQCGEGAYKVIRFEFPDGSSLDGPDMQGEVSEGGSTL